MSFENLRGQDSVVSYLRASLRNNRISHAYIFSGPDVISKRFAAINFAKALNCLERPVTGPIEPGRRVDGCDQCSSCKKIDSSKHPDVFTLRPAEEGASVIMIEEIRALIKDIYLKPFEADKKVYVIEGAEHMKTQAANALLKTLEEPPADSIIILLTENIKALLRTIVSRCQVVRFFPLKLKDIEEILTKDYSLNQADAHILSRLSGGRLGEALKFKEEDIFTKRSLLINKIVSGSRADFDFDDIPKEDVRIYLDMILAWYSDMLRMKAGLPDYMLVNIDKKDIISNESEKFSFDYIEDIIDGAFSAMMHIDQDANQKLAMSVLGMKIKQVSACTK